MSYARYLTIVAVSAATLLTSTPAVHAAAPLPQATKRVETVVANPAIPGDVQETFVKLYYPMPAGSPAHPAACDWIGYMRWRHKAGPTDSARADAVLNGMPGLSGGAGGLTQIGSQVVHLAGQRGKHVEFWAIDRRSNCLEDHTGLDAANKAKDARVAADYYWNGKAVDGHKFPGWLADKDVPIVGELGAARTLDDWRAVIQQGLPNPADHKKVLCGGHSLGGLVTSLMTAWDFDKDPATTQDAGKNLCGGGYFALDTIVTTNPLGIQSLPFLSAIPKLLGGTVEAATNLVRSGFLRTFTLLASPESATLLDVVGSGARYQGDQESELLRRIPRGPGVDGMLKMAYARDLGEFLSSKFDMRARRYTGEALLGSLVDNNMQPIALNQVSLGTLDSAEVAPKHFPLPGQLSALPGVGKLLDDVVAIGTAYTPTSSSALYRWRNYNQVAAAPKQLAADGAALTGPDNEVTDIRTYATEISTPGVADDAEWYFPTRLLIDILYGLIGTRAGDLSHMIHQDGATAHPVAAILGGRGPVQHLKLVGLVPKDAVVVPGYRHVDVVAAALKQNNGKLNQVATTLTGFTLGRIA